MMIRQMAGKSLRSLPLVIYWIASRFLPGAASDVSPSPERLDNVRRILVLRLDALGDFLMATPALRSLRRRFPGARIDMLVQPGVQMLASTYPGIDETIPLRCQFLLEGPRRLSGMAAWLSALRRLRKRRYDLVVDFTSLFHSAAAARLTGAPVRVGHLRKVPLGYLETPDFGRFYTHGVRTDENAHHADRMNDLITILGGEKDDQGWETVISPEMEREAGDILRREGIRPGETPLVIIHPGGKWPPRQWAASNFARVIDVLADQGIQTVVTAGPGEEAAVQTIRNNCRSAPLILWPPVSPRAFLGLLKMADAFLGNDSGPMHMAAAAGTPTVAIFGPNSPQRVAPRGSPLVTFYSALDCSPCQQYVSRDRCHRGHNYCMDDYDPAEVAAALLHLVHEGRPIHPA